VRVQECGDKVLVTYAMKRPDGGTGRNAEVLTFDGDRVCAVELDLGRKIEWTPLGHEHAGGNCRRAGDPAQSFCLTKREPRSSHRRPLRWTMPESAAAAGMDYCNAGLAGVGYRAGRAPANRPLRSRERPAW
jgi:hypothetical protein